MDDNKTNEELLKARRWTDEEFHAALVVDGTHGPGDTQFRERIFNTRARAISEARRARAVELHQQKEIEALRKKVAELEAQPASISGQVLGQELEREHRRRRVLILTTRLLELRVSSGALNPNGDNATFRAAVKQAVADAHATLNAVEEYLRG